MRDTRIYFRTLVDTVLERCTIPIHTESICDTPTHPAMPLLDLFWSQCRQYDPVVLPLLLGLALL
jgi:hypothetical protein